MKIETDRVEILSGVRWGETLGSPVTLTVSNSDWVNWQETMSLDPACRDESIMVTRARPGHADLPGALKYGHHDVRNILERSSARETAVRVAAGSLAKALLAHFGIVVMGYVRELGPVKATAARGSLDTARQIVECSPFYTVDPAADDEMRRVVDAAREAGDSIGGVVEVLIRGVPPGIGSHVQWDRRLEARISMALMGIQAIRGVEFGLGFEAARRPGSQVHDEIFHDNARIEAGAYSGFYRLTNNAGGIEGGMSNGEEIVVRAAMKPIPTLYTPLRSVDIRSKEPYEAAIERSDICAVPAASVVAEAAVALEVAAAFVEKFGGDSVPEMGRNHQAYLDYLRVF
jgi:chorismate synthase